MSNSKAAADPNSPTPPSPQHGGAAPRKGGRKAATTGEGINRGSLSGMEFSSPVNFSHRLARGGLFPPNTPTDSAKGPTGIDTKRKDSTGYATPELVGSDVSLNSEEEDARESVEPKKKKRRSVKWTGRENQILYLLQPKLGNQWSQIYRVHPLTQRTPQALKNRFSSTGYQRDIREGAAWTKNIPDDVRELVASHLAKIEAEKGQLVLVSKTSADEATTRTAVAPSSTVPATVAVSSGTSASGQDAQRKAADLLSGSANSAVAAGPALNKAVSPPRPSAHAKGLGAAKVSGTTSDTTYPRTCSRQPAADALRLKPNSAILSSIQAMSPTRARDAPVQFDFSDPCSDPIGALPFDEQLEEAFWGHCYTRH